MFFLRAKELWIMDGVLSGSVINSVVEVEIESQVCRYFNHEFAYTYGTLIHRSVVYTGFIRMYSAMTH